MLTENQKRIAQINKQQKRDAVVSSIIMNTVITIAVIISASLFFGLVYFDQITKFLFH